MCSPWSGMADVDAPMADAAMAPSLEALEGSSTSGGHSLASSSTSGGHHPAGASTSGGQTLVDLYIDCQMFNERFCGKFPKNATFDDVKHFVAKQMWKSTGLWYSKYMFILLSRVNSAPMPWNSTLEFMWDALVEANFTVKIKFHVDVARADWRRDERRIPLRASGGEAPADEGWEMVGWQRPSRSPRSRSAPMRRR